MISLLPRRIDIPAGQPLPIPELDPDGRLTVFKRPKPLFCTQCGGAGWVYINPFAEDGTDYETEVCDKCNGTGSAQSTSPIQEEPCQQ